VVLGWVKVTVKSSGEPSLALGLVIEPT
jgi:hypothetical protein